MKHVFIKMVLSVLLCTLTISLVAQSTLEGRVSSKTGGALEYVHIKMKEAPKGTQSNNHGKYKLKTSLSGNHVVIFSLVGFHTIEKQVILSPNQSVQLDVELEPDTKQLEEVTVVSAAQLFAKKQSDYVARMPLNNLENPQVYTVVPKELVQEQMAIDFRSAISAAPGLNNITQSVGSGGVGLSLRTRGFSGNAGSLRNGANTNWVTMNDPSNLESIEVIKGPSATLFGSTLITYGGLVNRVTKKPLNFFKGELSYSTGSWALSRTTLDINMPLNEDKSMLLRVNTALDNQKTWQDYGRSSTVFFSPAFRYKVDERLTIDFEFELFKSTRNASYFGTAGSGPKSFTSFDDMGFDFKRSYTTDEFVSENQNRNIFAQATYKLSDNWTSQTIFSNAFTENKANYLFLLITTDSTMNRRLMSINSFFKTTQLQQNFVGDFNIGNKRNRLLIGAEYVYLGTNDNRWIANPYDIVKINQEAPLINMEKYQSIIASSKEPFLINHRNRNTWSIYASDVINFTERLLLMASLRVDNFSDETSNYKQTTLSPKFGLVYQMIKDKVSLFSNYMNGFSNVAPTTTAASPNIPVAFKPEQANQLEGGVKVELLEGKLNGTLSYYDIQVSNKVRTDPNNPLFSIQDGTQSSTGFEADLIANPFKGFHIIFGYGFNESKFIKAASNVEGKRPYSTPKHVGNIWASYKVETGKAKGIGFGIGSNHQSESFVNDTNTFTAKGFTTVDATIFWEKTKFRFGIKMNNITNERYWLSDYWANMMPTRQLVANMTLRF